MEFLVSARVNGFAEITVYEDRAGPLEERLNRVLSKRYECDLDPVVLRPSRDRR